MVSSVEHHDNGSDVTESPEFVGMSSDARLILRFSSISPSFPGHWRTRVNSS